MFVGGYYVLLVLGLVSLGFAQDQYNGRRLLRRQQAPVEVLEKEILKPKVYEVQHQISPNVGDGSFKYYSAFSDGLESEQHGHFNNPLDSQVHQGSYTTTDEHGQVVRVNYVADKDGFRPVDPNGTPILPQAPQESLEHIKAREDILRQQKEIREQHLGYLRAGYAVHGR